MKPMMTLQSIALPHRIGDLENRHAVHNVCDFLPHRIGDLEIHADAVFDDVNLPHRIGDLEIQAA